MIVGATHRLPTRNCPSPETRPPDPPNRKEPTPMPTNQRSTRMLYLDDSGAISLNHSSGAVVIGGLSVSSARVPKLTRRISGAKAHHFPERGRPSSWEMKSTALLTSKGWRNRRNRALVLEVIRILGGLDCTVYTASINKAKMHHSMATKTSLPMQLHRLVEHFAVECAHRNEIGIVVMDRSENRLDAHASHCVASYVTTKNLPLHPVVHYVDSMTSEPTQAADLISAARRRTIEGTPGMHVLNTQLTHLRVQGLTTKRTHTNRPWTNQIVVI